MSVILLTRRCEDTNHKAETAEKRVILTFGHITCYIMKDMSRARLTLGNQVSFQTIRLINCTKQRNKIIEKKREADSPDCFGHDRNKTVHTCATVGRQGNNRNGTSFLT